MEINRDLPTAITAKPSRDVPRFVSGSLWWVLPPAAALLYPLTVGAPYESGKLHPASVPTKVLAWLTIAVSAAFVYGVPVAGIYVAYLLGRDETSSSSRLLARRLAHLTVASPPLFVLIGVVLYLLHAANGETAVWWIFWIAALIATVWTVRTSDTDRPASITPNSIPLRMAHGTSALLILVIFLALHLLNHATAAFSREFDSTMMTVLRKWYRSEWVQPVLVILVLFQVVSGLILFWRATAMRSDLHRTLQTSTGVYMTVFIASHLNAVLILGRAVTKVDTTFLWASGAPVGLLPDAWNVRLIPHYSLGVWFVIGHIGLGLRGVLLAHGISASGANRAAWVLGAVGAALALTITVAQLRVHAT